MTRATFLHLRFPFSFFLMPVYLFALAVYADVNIQDAVLIFIILHLLVYPASNGYNSYFDKDEKSIGGLKNPPKTSKELYYWALVLDVIALGLGLMISWQFSFMILIYGLVSKAYSHPMIRLKSMPVVGWLSAGVFQGYFTFLTVVIGLQGFGLSDLLDIQWQVPAALSSLLLMGSYPMTQIYQHEEDNQRGDKTISLYLGILGTFYFTGGFFFFSNTGLLLYFFKGFGLTTAVLFQLSLLPVIGYFLYWFLKVLKDQTRADFEHTMRLNLISSVMLNIFFFGWYLSGLI